MKRCFGVQSRGFTLLELLIVIAVLAIVAGGLLVAYDGLESRSARGQSAFNLAAIDKGIRAYKVTSGVLPSDLDALLTENTSVSNESGDSPSLGSGQWFVGLHPQLQGLDGNLSTPMAVFRSIA